MASGDTRSVQVSSCSAEAVATSLLDLHVHRLAEALPQHTQQQRLEALEGLLATLLTTVLGELLSDCHEA